MLAFPEHTTMAARLRTFAGWPGTHTAAEMAAGGFLYTGSSDRVRCFYCGGGLDNWEPADDCFEQHALHFGRCNYVKFLKMCRERANRRRA